MSACDPCLARPWLLARLAGHLDLVRARLAPALELNDEELIAAVAGADRASVLRALARFDAEKARSRAEANGLELICRCQPDYPAGLRALASPPAVLHINGGLARFLELVSDEPVAIVGARRASAYGLEAATMLGRGLGAARVTVISGMALGIDCAAHAAALAAAGRTVGVLPGGADRPYPPSKHALWRRITASGAALAELPPATAVRRWMFPARNRIIAALCRMTILVEAAERSGALITVDHARALGRSVGAVPGRISSPLAAGPNGLLAGGALLVTRAQDVLDEIYGPGVRAALVGGDRPKLSPELKLLLDALGAGHDTPAALAQAGFLAERAFAGLASLELAGYIRREPGGRFTPRI